MSRFKPEKLSNEQTNDLVSKKLNWILSGCKPKRVYVFGSAARYEMTSKSDVDLAIIFETPEDVKIGRKALYSTPGRDLWPQDILFFDEPCFAAKSLIGGVSYLIAREGRIIFERS